jgi:hypothetical protein
MVVEIDIYVDRIYFLTTELRNRCLEKMKNKYLDTRYVSKSLKSRAEVELEKCRETVDNIYMSLRNHGEIMYSGVQFRWRKPQEILIDAFCKAVIPVVYGYKLGVAKWEYWSSTIFAMHLIKTPLYDILMEGGRRIGKSEVCFSCLAYTLWYNLGNGVRPFVINLNSVGLAGAKLGIDKIKSILSRLAKYLQSTFRCYTSIIDLDITLQYFKEKELIHKDNIDRLVEPTAIRLVLTDKKNPLVQQIIEAHASGKVRIFFNIDNNSVDK